MAIPGVNSLLDFSVELAILAVTALAYLIRKVIYMLKRLDGRMSRIEEEIDVSPEQGVRDMSRIDAHERDIRELNETQDKMLRYLTGDPNDPANDGLLAEIDNLRQMMQRIEQRLEMGGAFGTQLNEEIDRENVRQPDTESEDKTDE